MNTEHSLTVTRSLLAKLSLDSLTRKTRPREIREALERLKQRSRLHQLNDAYREANVRIEGQSEEQQKLAKDVLSWIAHAKRPLS